MNIKQLTADNLAIFKAIRLKSLKEESEQFLTTYEEEYNKPDTHFLKKLETAIWLGAFNGEKLVGTIGYAGYPQKRFAHKAIVFGTYVLPDYRGQGWSKLLMEALIDSASPSFDVLTLMVVSGNDAAIRLYENYGFHTYGKELRSAKMEDGTYRDDLLMQRMLK